MAVHTDGAEQVWGGKFGPDAVTRAKGICGNLGTWTARERKESIALRVLKSAHLVLGRRSAADVSQNEVRRDKFSIDTSPKVYHMQDGIAKSRDDARSTCAPALYSSG
jgi:hypothetical protein